MTKTTCCSAHKGCAVNITSFSFSGEIHDFQQILHTHERRGKLGLADRPKQRKWKVFTSVKPGGGQENFRFVGGGTRSTRRHRSCFAPYLTLLLYVIERMRKPCDVTAISPPNYWFLRVLGFSSPKRDKKLFGYGIYLFCSKIIFVTSKPIFCCEFIMQILTYVYTVDDNLKWT